MEVHHGFVLVHQGAEFNKLHLINNRYFSVLCSDIQCSLLLQLVRESSRPNHLNSGTSPHGAVNSYISSMFIARLKILNNVEKQLLTEKNLKVSLSPNIHPLICCISPQHIKTI